MKYRKPVHTAACGKVASVKGRPFTQNSLKDHQYVCAKCRELLGWLPLQSQIRLRDLIGQDEPDGVYWAMPGYFV